MTIPKFLAIVACQAVIAAALVWYMVELKRARADIAFWHSIATTCYAKK